MLWGKRLPNPAIHEPVAQNYFCFVPESEQAGILEGPQLREWLDQTIQFLSRIS
jgi:hypothetical protein